MRRHQVLGGLLLVSLAASGLTAMAFSLYAYGPKASWNVFAAAMIAAAAYPKFLAQDFAAMDFSAEAGLRL